MSLTPTFILHSAGFPLHVGHFEHYFVILTSLGLIIRSSLFFFFLSLSTSRVFDVLWNTRQQFDGLTRKNIAADNISY